MLRKASYLRLREIRFDFFGNIIKVSDDEEAYIPRIEIQQNEKGFAVLLDCAGVGSVDEIKCHIVPH